jgi:hypothetical protein
MKKHDKTNPAVSRKSIVKKSILALTAASMLGGLGSQAMAGGSVMEPGESTYSSSARKILMAPVHAAKTVASAVRNHPYKAGALIIGAVGTYAIYAFAKSNNYDPDQMLVAAKDSIRTFWPGVDDFSERVHETFTGQNEALADQYRDKRGALNIETSKTYKDLEHAQTSLFNATIKPKLEKVLASLNGERSQYDVPATDTSSILGSAMDKNAVSDINNTVNLIQQYTLKLKDLKTEHKAVYEKYLKAHSITPISVLAPFKPIVSLIAKWRG